jgi:hypothetical protein
MPKNTRIKRHPRGSGTPRTKGGLKIIHADGTIEEQPSNYQAARATVRKAERRKYQDRGG